MRLWCRKFGSAHLGLIKVGREAEHKARCTADHTSFKMVKQPSLASLERQSNDGVVKALDGCLVEPDGMCPHGLPSWMLRLGYI